MAPKLLERNAEKLYDLVNIFSDIETAKTNKRVTGVLPYYDSSLKSNQILSKFTSRLQNKWRDKAVGYKRSLDYT